MDCCSGDSVQPEPSASTARPVPGWKRASAVITAVGVALLPKCPACWSVYAGLSSVLGVSFVLERALLLPLTLGSLALALTTLGSMAWRTQSYLPFALGVASSLAVWAGKFALNIDTLTWVGLLGLILASIVARRRGGRVRRPSTRAPGSELPEHAQAG